MADCLGKLAFTEVQKQSKTLVQTMSPEIDSVNQKLRKLSGEIDNKTMGINSSLIRINDKLIDIHVGKAISDYVLVGALCLVIGISGSLRIVQTFYGNMLKHSYQTEYNAAAKEGKTEYRKQLVQNDDGLIEILELEKRYYINHAKSYKNVDDYVKTLDARIKKLKK